MGRKSTFNEKAAAEIVARLRKGEPLTIICRDAGLPCDDTVRNWADANADFARDIARAREAGFDQIALDALAIADATENDTKFVGGEDGSERAVANAEWISRSKLRVETRLKLLAKWDPKRYGDKVALTGGSEGDSPVQFQNVTDRDRAKAMAALIAKSKA